MTTTAEAAQPPPIGRHGRFTDAERSHLADAQSVLPGGVMGSTRLPDDIALVFSHGKGARFRDTSGNEYIDYCLGSGPLILGHAHDAVVAAVTEQASRGTHFFSMLNRQAILLARRIADQDEPLAFARVERRLQRGGSRDTVRAYTGTVPDYASETEGLLLSNVIEGGPAQEAGLRGGDVIVEFAGQAIANIYDYTYALDDVKVDVPVEVVFMRDGVRHTVTLTPGARP